MKYTITTIILAAFLFSPTAFSGHESLKKSAEKEGNKVSEGATRVVSDATYTDARHEAGDAVEDAGEAVHGSKSD